MRAKKYFLFPVFCLLSCTALAVPRPRVVVNIVISGMRYDYIARFGENLTADGFNRFVQGGVVYANARYDFVTTAPPATLATLVTGANPAIHGIVGRSWIDMVSGASVDLIADRGARGLDTEPNEGGYSYANQIVATLTDELRAEQPTARTITIAADPVAAVVLGGRAGETYWIDEGACTWISSSRYMNVMPEWVRSYNNRAYERGGIYQRFEWSPLLPQEKYVNRRYTQIILNNPSGRFTRLADIGHPRMGTKRYSEAMTTPAVSEFTADFVRQAVTYAGFGKDDVPDVLNVWFGNLRLLGEEYGSESVELEDAFYRLDRTLATMINFIKAQYGDRVLFVLTSDGGMSASFDALTQERDRFNSEQFRIIANSFLTAQYGGTNWVLSINDHRIYLNRSQAYKLGLNLDEIRERLATFAIQFRGVANSVSAAAMQNGGFTDPIRRRIQNSYYPQRGGDVVLSFIPGFIDLTDGVRAQSGSPYDYDTHVPLMFWGGGLNSETITRNVDMTSFAITEADLMGINRPDAAMGEGLHEIVDKFR